MKNNLLFLILVIYLFSPITYIEAQEEEVKFENNGIVLSGTIHHPPNLNIKQHPAIILIHGSGGESRDGTCSLYKKNAKVFNDLGFIVLTYDKRGVGNSTGDWRSASFDTLATDVIRAIDYLKSRTDVNKDNICLWGVSQAGWIMAKVNTLSNDIKCNIMVGAAGAGITVSEQNSYNIKTLLTDAGASSNAITKIDTLWTLFYDLISNRNESTIRAYKERYLSITKSFRAYSNFYPPNYRSIDFSKNNQWYTSLSLDYNPYNDWKNCKAQVLAIFGENDKYTPVKLVSKNLELALLEAQCDFKIEVLPQGNHILTEGDFCTTPLRKDYIYILKKWTNEALNN